MHTDNKTEFAKCSILVTNWYSILSDKKVLNDFLSERKGLNRDFESGVDFFFLLLVMHLMVKLEIRFDQVDFYGLDEI